MNTIIVGGAGFIGSHFVDRLLESDGGRVRIYDNFSSGREWHFERHVNNERLSVIRGSAEQLDSLCEAMNGFDRVIHLASNPDIAKAMEEPTIDFVQGTALTSHVAEAARLVGAKEILYASGSGVYGELGTHEVEEDFGPLRPTSPYGASKLAGEALMSAYSAMFGISASAFRFGNVVGPRQTHGVGFDFIRRLRRDPSRLLIRGDGTQSKPYIHVNDIVDAVLQMSAARRESFETFNVATQDAVTVREIAEIAMNLLGTDSTRCDLTYTGGDRGWKGDVPIVRLSTRRIRSRGWTSSMSSREAVTASMRSILEDDESGRFGT